MKFWISIFVTTFCFLRVACAGCDKILSQAGVDLTGVTPQFESVLRSYLRATRSRVEIMEGKLYSSKPAADTIVTASQNLLRKLFDGRSTYFVGRTFKLWMRHPGQDPEIVSPDLVAWKDSQLTQLLSKRFFETRPDWVCEVLEPGRASYDRVRKKALYARYGVPMYWILDPAEGTLEVFHLVDGVWQNIESFAAYQIIRARPFEDVCLNLKIICNKD